MTEAGTTGFDALKPWKGAGVDPGEAGGLKAAGFSDEHSTPLPGSAPT